MASNNFGPSIKLKVVHALLQMHQVEQENQVQNFVQDSSLSGTRLSTLTSKNLEISLFVQVITSSAGREARPKGLGWTFRQINMMAFANNCVQRTTGLITC